MSFALGAFLAGAVVGESDMSHQAAADALPLRDAFAVLFFVSVGMLVDPAYLVANPLPILGVLLLIVAGQGRAQVRARAPWSATRSGSASRSAAGLAQIGEFSFILGTVGLSTRPAAGRRLPAHRRRARSCRSRVNPFLFDAIRPLEARLRGEPAR